MSWLRKLFGGGGEASPEPSGQPPRDHDPVPPLGPAANPVQALLDALEAPWRLSRAELEARFGRSEDPTYGWEIIVLPTARPVVEGQFGPLAVGLHGVASSRMPATRFSALASLGGDARDNLRQVAAQLEPALGPARIRDIANTVGCHWRFGAASVGLTVWPPELQSIGPNEAEEREPRLATACHIEIETGWRPPLSDREQAWLDGFQPIARLPPDPYDPPPPQTATALESELELVREPPEDLSTFAGLIGRDAAGEAVIFCTRQLYVVPVADIVGVEVQRILPAKGGGGSHLSLRHRTPDGDVTSQWVAGAPGADDLNALGETVARAIGRPLTLEPYGYDC